jgi:hypothetical protein
MTGRSLQASQKGIQLAKQALITKRLRQKDLIGFVCQSRQPIGNFFTGKPVDREIFVGICERLGLNWQEIADLPKVGLTSPPAPLLQGEGSPVPPFASREGGLGREHVRFARGKQGRDEDPRIC